MQATMVLVVFMDQLVWSCLVGGGAHRWEGRERRVLGTHFALPTLVSASSLASSSASLASSVSVCIVREGDTGTSCSYILGAKSEASKLSFLK